MCAMSRLYVHVYHLSSRPLSTVVTATFGGEPLWLESSTAD